MKYTIAYTEIVPRLQELEADDVNQAIYRLNNLITQGTTSEKLTGLACNHEIVYILAENGDSFGYDANNKLRQYKYGRPG